MKVRILHEPPNLIGEIMSDADGYYGDEDFNSDEIDLSFLDED